MMHWVLTGVSLAFLLAVVGIYRQHRFVVKRLDTRLGRAEQIIQRYYMGHIDDARRLVVFYRSSYDFQPNALKDENVN